VHGYEEGDMCFEIVVAGEDIGAFEGGTNDIDASPDDSTAHADFRRREVLVYN
jgi:hypothetical protein